ncbi:MAG: MurR/RpiR family transcriptional regulator [Hungatella sp.]|jgi:DNA-binding MurR/RpiR family transcriptional regulator|nr:MurR/RpiR family transcriptional regulator [Hungatella sp.]
MVTLHLDDAVIKSLSNNELNVLKFVYEHIDEVLDMSIQTLAARTSYSSATILRFCKKLGYSGFAELKYALRAEGRKENPGKAASKVQDFGTRIMIDSLCSNVEGTSNLISEDQLSLTFRYFDSNCPIYLWAPGGITSILSDYFEKLLFSIGRQNVYKIESSKMGEHILKNIRTESLLVLISTTGDFGPTVRLGKIARMNNVPILSITPYTNNEVASLATVNFRFFTNQRENRGAEFTSRLPVFYMIDVIIRCYLQYKLSGQDQTKQGENHDSFI